MERLEQILGSLLLWGEDLLNDNLALVFTQSKYLKKIVVRLLSRMGHLISVGMLKHPGIPSTLISVRC